MTFTVFTATYNRAHLITRVFRTLQRQTCTDFEWIIIDDGSTDDTASVVRSFEKEASFPIRYFFQKNTGKHAAFNSAVCHARGQFFLTIDSDDYCVNHGLETLLKYWNAIPDNAKNDFSGVFSLCVDLHGIVIGTPFPANVYDVNFLQAFYMDGVLGDKWGFFRTDILRKHPFPIIQGETFITEAIVWNVISLRYKTRFINEKLLIVDYQNDGYSALSDATRIKNPKGAALYYGQFLALPVPFHWRARNAINFIRFTLHAKRSLVDSITNLNGPNILLLVSALPFGIALFLRDIIYIR